MTTTTAPFAPFPDTLNVCSECYYTEKMHPRGKCPYQTTHYDPIRCRKCAIPIRFNVFPHNFYGSNANVDLSVNPLYCGRCGD